MAKYFERSILDRIFEPLDFVTTKSLKFVPTFKDDCYGLAPGYIVAIYGQKRREYLSANKADIEILIEPAEDEKEKKVYLTNVLNYALQHNTTIAVISRGDLKEPMMENVVSRQMKYAYKRVTAIHNYTKKHFYIIFKPDRLASEAIFEDNMLYLFKKFESKKLVLVNIGEPGYIRIHKKSGTVYRYKEFYKCGIDKYGTQRIANNIWGEKHIFETPNYYVGEYGSNTINLDIDKEQEDLIKKILEENIWVPGPPRRWVGVEKYNEPSYRRNFKVKVSMKIEILE